MAQHKLLRVINENISKELILLAKKLKIKYLNVHSFYINLKLLIFEFNGRLSGTFIMISKIFNLIELFIKEIILKNDINPQLSEELFFAIDYYNEIYTIRYKIKDIVNRSKNLFNEKRIYCF